MKKGVESLILILVCILAFLVGFNFPLSSRDKVENKRSATAGFLFKDGKPVIEKERSATAVFLLKDGKPVKIKIGESTIWLYNGDKATATIKNNEIVSYELPGPRSRN